jgi:hypothetical protein
LVLKGEILKMEQIKGVDVVLYAGRRRKEAEFRGILHPYIPSENTPGDRSTRFVLLPSSVTPSRIPTGKYWCEWEWKNHRLGYSADITDPWSVIEFQESLARADYFSGINLEKYHNHGRSD